MRTLSKRTNTLACWAAIGMLSACTVNVTETPADDSEDSGARTTDEPAESTEGAESRGDGGAGQPSDETGDPQTIGVSIDVDGGGTPVTVDGGEEGDAGPVSDRIACGSRDVAGAEVVEGNITDSATWSGTVHVTGPVYLMNGGTLTIEPGTKIIMDVDSFLDLGYNSGAVSVFAAGTAEEPITICGKESEAGFWRSVTFGPNVTSNSTFKNVLVSDGGSDAAAVVLNADVHVENLQVAESGSIGVSAVDFADDSAKLSVFGSEGAAVRLTGSGAFTHFPLGGKFEDNAQQMVVVDFGDIEGDDAVTIHNVGIPYLQKESLYLYGTAELTIEGGVDYRFAADTFFDVGYNSSAPTLIIDGTEEEPVVFQGQANEPGYWRGLMIGVNVRTNSVISHLTISDGGGDEDPALWVRSAITLSDVTLEGNETGALIGAQGLDPDSANLTITETESVPLTVDGPDALITLPEGSYTGNDDDVIAITGDDYTTVGTIANLGVPYRVLESIYTYDDSSMTIEPGVIFEMAADTFFTFGYNSGAATVHAVGTEEEPIVFTGVDASAGSWRGLNVELNVTTDSSFEYVTVEHAGNPVDTADSAAIYLDAAVAVENCTFNEIAGYGIILDVEANSELVTGNTATGVTLGVNLDLTIED